MIRSLRSRGLLYSAGVVINRVVPERLFRFRIFRICQLQSAGAAAGAGTLLLRWCESEQDFRTARQLTYFATPEPSVAADYRACLAIQDGEPIGGVWTARERFDEPELGLRYLFVADQDWIFAAYVSKPHRQRGVYRSLLASVLDSDPSRRHYVCFNPLNKASLAAHAPFVRTTLGSCVAMRLGNVAFAWSTGSLRIRRRFTIAARTVPLEIDVGSEGDLL
jgi:GNAT superfamily N-acetyltransferase